MEGGDGDSLSNNAFLRMLRSKFKDVWQLAEEEQLFVCIPVAGSFARVGDVTRDVVESHVLRDSKLFVNQFVSLNGRTVTVDGSKVVPTGPEWGAAVVERRILFEELFYNRAWKKFRVVCIDGALVGGQERNDDAPKLPALAHRTLHNSKLYLEAFPENEIVLRKVRENVASFVASYYIVKGFEHHARDKVKGLLTRAMDDLLCTNQVFRQYHYEDRNMEALSQVVENYLFEGMHAKLFASMCTLHHDQDEDLHELGQAARLGGLSLSQMGSGEAFAADDLPLAAATLATLGDRVTPLEKLLCFREAIGAINDDLVAFREKKSGGERLRALSSSKDGLLVTSDELLPLLVFVIVRSGVAHVLATVAYAEFFTFFDVNTSELGFCLTSVKAAVTLMLRSQLLRRMRRERFPESVYVEGNKRSGSSRASRSSNVAPPPGMPRTVSVPASIHDVRTLPKQASFDERLTAATAKKQQDP